MLNSNNDFFSILFSKGFNPLENSILKKSHLFRLEWIRFCTLIISYLAVISIEDFIEKPEYLVKQYIVHECLV